MKICLINPPQVLHKSNGIPTIFFPLGLSYIAATLEQKHDVHVIDACAEGSESVKDVGEMFHMGLPYETIEEKIIKLKPDIVGITVPFTVNAHSALKVADTIKKIDNKIVTVLGGPHPTVNAIKTLSHATVDYIVIGEGEHTILELVNKVENEALNELNSVQGIGFKKSDQAVITSPRPYIQQLDSLPFPARNLFPMETYFHSNKEGGGARSLYTQHERSASIFTSRGCPFKCNFCSINLTMGRIFRPRSAENVAEEIERLISDYGIRHINFEDDNITFDKERLHKICDYIIDKKWNITWSTPNGIRADIIDDALVQKMKRSGCRRVFVAPESGVQSVLNNIIGKKMDLNRVTESVKLFKKYGVEVDGSFVIGFIGETKSDICKTILYALKLKRLGMSQAGFHIATPLYGTKLYDEAKEKGYLCDEMCNASRLHPFNSLIETPEWSGVELRQLRGVANFLVNYSTKEKILAIYKHRKSLLKYVQYFKRFMPFS